MNIYTCVIYITVFVIALGIAHLNAGVNIKVSTKPLKKIGVKPCNYNEYIALKRSLRDVKKKHQEHMKMLHLWEDKKYDQLQNNFSKYIKQHDHKWHNNNNNNNNNNNEKQENEKLLKFKISKKELHAKCNRQVPNKKFQLIETTRSLKSKVKDNIYNTLKKYLRNAEKSVLANRRFKTCAVVGNGGVLLDNPYNGYTIDQHDAVFRINEGPTTGFEKHVGVKTTIRLSYGPSCGGMSQAEYAHNICALPLEWHSEATIFAKKYDSWELIYKDQYAHWKNYASFTKETSKIHAEGNVSVPLEFALANLDILKDLKKTVGQWPTTGIVGIRLATEICDCVNIYGFSAGRHVNSGKETFKYHYYDTLVLPGYQAKKDEKDTENPHKYNKEGDWILNLIKSGTINDMSFPQDNKDWKL